MPKLIFFDIDGTLWDDHMQIPDSTITTLKKLQDNGHRIFLCSGGSKANIRDPKLLSLGFDGIVAACGNHIEVDGKVIYENILPPEMVKKVITVLKECHMPVVLEGPECHWIDKDGFKDDPFILYLFQALEESSKELTVYEPDMRVNKFSADVLPDTDFDRVKAELGDEFEILEHEGNVVEFVPKESSKATGIERLCQFLGVDQKDTYALGDSVNDLDMLSYVGHGIAMGNASEAAKAAAEYVTADIHEDGIMRAMEHYGLI